MGSVIPEAVKRRVFRAARHVPGLRRMPLLRPLVRMDGFCPVCEQATVFCSWRPWLREGLFCLNCHSLPRERALIGVLSELRPHWRDLRIHESSPASLSSKLSKECAGYQPSRFDPGATPGAFVPHLGCSNEDLEHQTFADDSFDIVIAQDVLEHLFSPKDAMREIARTLAPGGLCLCTTPLVVSDGLTIQRAYRDTDGGIRHVLPAEYHHNPVDPAGSLVTFAWGRDVADLLQGWSGLKTTIRRPDDPGRGVVGELLEVLVCESAIGPGSCTDGASFGACP